MKHNKDEKKSDESVGQKRDSLRKMLLSAGVIGGATASSNWKKPAIDSVFIPAHAATTGAGGDEAAS